jgi:hypothetical protein
VLIRVIECSGDTEVLVKALGSPSANMGSRVLVGLTGANGALGASGRAD